MRLRAYTCKGSYPIRELKLPEYSLIGSQKHLLFHWHHFTYLKKEVKIMEPNRGKAKIIATS